MFRSLQARLTLSHIFPLLILLPILGFLLLYLLETRYFLSNFANELKGQGVLVAEFTRTTDHTWSDPEVAADVVTRLEDKIPAQVSFFDPQGNLLATSAPFNPSLSPQPSDSTVTDALHGSINWRVKRNNPLHLGALDMAIPVVDDQDHVLGVVRLEQPMDSLEGRLSPLRWLFLLTFSGALAVAAIPAVLLAHSLSRSLSMLTAGVRHLVPGEPPEHILETGPEEIRAIAASFNRLSQRLYKLEIARRQLLASIVHELGRPLGAIKAASYALQQDALEDPDFSRELVTGITGQVDQLRLLVDDLSLLAESELHEPALRREMVCLPEIVAAQCDAYDYLMQEKQIKLSCTIDPVRPVVGDKARLTQIFVNLLHNAYKYTPINGRVQVTVSEEADFVLLRVGDTGPGIPVEEQSRIFTLFYRAPSKGIHKGMGIGLAIAQKLADAHGGTLTVTSEPGSGTEFTLRLLAASDPVSPCPQPHRVS
jgi:two-component system sensor histidine kinase BaeS